MMRKHIVGCSPICKTCGLRKKPIGRDAAPAMANSLCDHECKGYREEPTPCYLWPGERSDGMSEAKQELNYCKDCGIDPCQCRWTSKPRWEDERVMPSGTTYISPIEHIAALEKDLHAHQQAIQAADIAINLAQEAYQAQKERADYSDEQLAGQSQAMQGLSDALNSDALDRISKEIKSYEPLFSVASLALTTLAEKQRAALEVARKAGYIK